MDAEDYFQLALEQERKLGGLGNIQADGSGNSDVHIQNSLLTLNTSNVDIFGLPKFNRGLMNKVVVITS